MPCMTFQRFLIPACIAADSGMFYHFHFYLVYTPCTLSAYEISLGRYIMTVTAVLPATWQHGSGVRIIEWWPRYAGSFPWRDNWQLHDICGVGQGWLHWLEVSRYGQKSLWKRRHDHSPTFFFYYPMLHRYTLGLGLEGRLIKNCELGARGRSAVCRYTNTIHHYRTSCTGVY